MIECTAGLEPANLQVIERVIQRNLLTAAISMDDATTNRLQTHRQDTTTLVVVVVVVEGAVLVYVVTMDDTTMNQLRRHICTGTIY